MDARVRTGPTAAIGIAWLATVFAGAGCAAGAPDPQPVGAVLAAGEHGSFLLHKFQQQIGEEHWSVAAGPAGPDDDPILRVDFQFTDRGAPVALTATLQARTDGTPLAFAVHGRTARQVELDDDVDARGVRVQIRQGSASREADRPQRFFTIAAYAPVAVQQLLLRYWRAHGTPDALATFPSGSVRIEHRGHDTVDVAGKATVLDRYAVSGLVWGRETVWLEKVRSVVADGAVYECASLWRSVGFRP
jgi:hypothetical protein